VSNGSTQPNYSITSSAGAGSFEGISVKRRQCRMEIMLFVSNFRRPQRIAVQTALERLKLTAVP
jgi:hypothetical protein